MTLGRDVAIKILPESFAADPDRLMRFEREARTLASLNHPHIAQIYGFEDGGHAHPGRALIMELVEGEDLARRLARGAIPLDDALPIARQIAEALEAAHERGVIHRDLKPGNIKLAPDGTVKVLDFGLAKVTHQEAAADRADLTESPTIRESRQPCGTGRHGIGRAHAAHTEVAARRHARSRCVGGLRGGRRRGVVGRAAAGGPRDTNDHFRFWGRRAGHRRRRP